MRAESFGVCIIESLTALMFSCVRSLRGLTSRSFTKGPFLKFSTLNRSDFQSGTDARGAISER